jgi:hypothetical protein
MTKLQIGVITRYGVLSAIMLAATALAPTPASAAVNCLQPENVPWSLTFTPNVFEQARHHAAIVACQQREVHTQSLSLEQSAFDAPARAYSGHARRVSR